MNKLFRLILIFMSVLIVITFNINGSANQLDLDDRIDRFITTQMKTHHIPGLALAITHNNQVLHVKGYSTANNERPVTAQTQFLIASMSKSFTAMAVMQLVEAGQINLDSPVQTYLPEFTVTDPAIAAKITIRHLLNQVSGLSDVGFPDELQVSQATTIRDRITSLSQARPVALPGSQFNYFNPNYEVLARVVEVVSQQPFSAYLQTHIFTPLQMSRTLNPATSADAFQGATNMAQGHLMAFGLPFAYPEMSGYVGGSSGIISTAEDMANYLIFQTNSGQFKETKLLSESSVALMHTPPKTIGSSYGMGWFKGSENGEPAIEHTGNLSTFYTEVVLLPKEKYGIALLYNINAWPLTAAFPQIKTGLIQLLKDGQPAAGGFSITLWGIAIALLMFIGVMLAIRSLLYLPQWKQAIRITPLWRVWLGIGCTFLPAFFLLVLPWLLALVFDQFFGYVPLFRSMLDLMLWLSVCAVLGVVNGIARLILLARSNGAEY
jgi:CubicO group peptidase (beta-lactamase class C family)